jgi:DegV family protein with EDD domain
MSIGIVTDSSCDLPQNIIDENNIVVVPMFINIGSESYRDGVDITREEFYSNLPVYKSPPKTAAPGPDAFRAVYQKMADAGITEILSIHISSSLSGVMNSARQAAKEFTPIPVTAFDSRQLSLGTGFQALAAAKAAALGRTMNEIINLLEDQISRTYSFAALGTLEFLKRSGRMNGAVFMLGNLLDIKPILRMYNGNPTSERIRTRKRAFNRMASFLEKIGNFETAALMHTHVYQEAQDFWELVSDKLPSGEKMCVEINPVIGSHIGPGAIGFVCIAKEKPKHSPW